MVHKWARGMRIAPGEPEGSLVYRLMSVRTGGDGQMPPIATRELDEEGVALLHAWISQLEPTVLR